MMTTAAAIHASRIHLLRIQFFIVHGQASNAPARPQQRIPLPDEYVAASARIIATTVLGPSRMREQTTTNVAVVKSIGITFAKPMPHSQFSHAAGVKISRLQ